MKKGIVAMLVMLALLGVCAGACAAGVTLRVFTPFADVDFAAQSYMDMVTAWEAETGNLVEDYSGLQDESWIDQMSRMVASGEADVAVVPVGSPLTGAQVLTAQELTQAPHSQQTSSSTTATSSTVMAPRGQAVSQAAQAMQASVSMFTAMRILQDSGVYSDSNLTLCRARAALRRGDARQAARRSGTARRLTSRAGERR